MCGLAGIARIGTDPVAGTPDPKHAVRRMVRRVEHRGPDGVSIGENTGNVRLGFARLSLVGLSNGQQPLTTPDGSLQLIANGEVYNHRDLETRLGVTPRTESDCEILLHCYQQHGPAMLKDVRGMVSVALWDRPRNRLVLARDPFGIKPLFFHSNTDRVVFASQATALFDDDATPRQVAWESALTDQLLAATPSFSDAPLTSWFEGIQLVPPGTALVIDLADGSITEHRYWELPIEPDEPVMAVDGYAEEYRRLLQRSVDDCETADVPVGLFLSGGIDSAAIAALSRNSPHTYTALNASTVVNGDAPSAARVASHLGLENEQVRFIDDDAPQVERWLDFLWLLETPMAGPEAFYKHEMYRYVRAVTPQVKAMMIGGGADEFNGGYSSTFTDDGWPAFESALAAMAAETAAEDDRRWAAWSASGVPLIRPHALRQISDLALRDPYAAFVRWKYRDVCQYNVWHEDRTAAGSGIEARVPFLDRELVEFSARVPRKLREDLLWDKEILRRGMLSLLPEDLARRKKVPFFYGAGVARTYRAFGQMILADDAALLERALAAPRAREFLDPDALRATARRCVDRPAIGQLEQLLRLLNLGLLDDMVRSGRPATADAPSYPHPEPVRIARDGVEAGLRAEVGLPASIDPSAYPILASGVDLLKTLDDSAVMVCVDGQIEFVLDRLEDEAWITVLAGADGTRPFGDFLPDPAALAQALPLLEQSTAEGVLLVGDSATPADGSGAGGDAALGVRPRGVTPGVSGSGLTATDVLRRPLTVRLRNFRGRTFVATGSDDAFELDDVASLVLKYTNGTRSLAEVADAVICEFDADPADVLGDVVEIAASMVEAGVLARGASV